MKKLVMLCAAAVAAAALGEPVATTGVPASAYVQNGLVAQWDGIENAGAGLHDGAATVWKDLTGRYDLSIVDGAVTWTDDAFVPPQVDHKVSAQNTSLAIGKFLAMDACLTYPTVSNTRCILGVGARAFNWRPRGFRVNSDATKSYLEPLESGDRRTIYADYTANNSTVQHCFMDGTNCTAVADSGQGLSSDGNSFVIGRCSNPYWTSTGAVHAVRLYSRALTADEILVNANLDMVRYRGFAPESLTWPTGYRGVAGNVEVKVSAEGGAGGSVTIDDAAVDSAWVVVGDSVTLKATPAAGKRFVRWTCAQLALTAEQALSATLTIPTLTCPTVIKAEFAAAGLHDVTDYVQDGLVAMFDGLYNVGVGKEHDPATKVWKELTGLSTDGTIDFRQGGWKDGAFLRTGPNAVPGYGSTSYLQYSLPQSFVDNLNANGGFTLDILCRYIGNSAGPGGWFALGGNNTASQLHLKASGDVLTYRNTAAGLNDNFGSLSSAKTNTVATIFDGCDRFTQYRNAILVKTMLNPYALQYSNRASSTTVGAFSAGAAQWGSSVDAYAIRVYQRALTAKEVMQNARVDDERYFGSNLTYVVSVKGDYGTPAPTNGLSRVTPGSGFSVASDVVALDAGSRMVVTGWEWTPDHGAKVSGTGSTPDVTVLDDGDFTWKWKKQYAFAVSAGAGGGVTSADAWQDEGTQVTITATPQSGYKLLGWSGDVGELADPLATTITVLVDRARTIAANFVATDHTPTTATFAKVGEAGVYSWNDAATWGGAAPGEGDEVVIEGTSAKSPTIVIDGPMPTFKSVFVRYATVIFTGWNNALRTTGDVTISSFGKLTHTNATADVMAEQHRVWVVCDNFRIINSGASIDVSMKGWPGVKGANAPLPPGATGSHSGPGGGVYGGLAGLGYGGWSSVKTYGSVTHPRDLGMAGSTTSDSTTPGNGGGSVLIEARGVVEVSSGGILANGGGGSGGSYAGNGSGGSIEIDCETITGTGTLQACGGAGLNGWGAAGGGGRIAINCDAAKQDALGATSLTFLVRPGDGWNSQYCHGGNTAKAEHGSLYLAAKSLLNETANVAARVYFPTPSYEASQLVIPNQRRVEFMQDGFQLTVAGDVTLNGASGLVLGGEVMQYFSDDTGIAPLGTRRIGGTQPVKATIGGSLTMAGKWSEIVLYPISSGTALDADGCPAGAVLEVGKTFTMQSGAVLYPISSGTNGISCSVRARNFDLQTGATVNANTRGYFGGCAYNYTRLPGQTVFGYNGSGWRTTDCTIGGSHGGLSGGLSDESALYGDAEHPVLPGAGSCIPNGLNSGVGGTGGGLIHIEASGRMTLNGTMQAHGSVATGNGHACAAAGGGVYLKAKRLFVGEGASISAKGCNANGDPKGGGGGRIAIWRMYDTVGSVDLDMLKTNVCNVVGGKANTEAKSGKPGTVFLGQNPVPGMILIVR